MQDVKVSVEPGSAHGELDPCSHRVSQPYSHNKKSVRNEWHTRAELTYFALSHSFLNTYATTTRILVPSLSSCAAMCSSNRRRGRHVTVAKKHASGVLAIQMLVRLP